MAAGSAVQAASKGRAQQSGQEQQATIEKGGSTHTVGQADEARLAWKHCKDSAGEQMRSYQAQPAVQQRQTTGTHNSQPRGGPTPPSPLSLSEGLALVTLHDLTLLLNLARLCLLYSVKAC